MGENQQQQQPAPEQQPGGSRRVLQRGHSGEGASSVLELLRRRRDLESQDAPGGEPADPAAGQRG